MKTTSAPKKAVYEKVSPFVVAQARHQFFKDNINHLYTRDCEQAVKSTLRQLANPITFDYVRTESLLEKMAADVLEQRFKNIGRAEDLGYVNAMGYDVLDLNENIYIELKDYSVGMRGGAKAPKLSAMVSNLHNKFCTVVALVIDPYLQGDKQYQLYAVPPEAIPSDTSNEIDMMHHKLIKTDKGTMYEEYHRLGGGFAKYKIDSLADLLVLEDRMKSINIKKLARVIRDLEASKVINETQKEELENLKVLFLSCIRIGNRKLTGKKKLPIDHNAPVFDIKEKKNQRIFFTGTHITFADSDK